MESLEKIAYDEVTKLPYCIGYFRKPTEDEIRRHSCLPFAMFQPAEKHGWGVTFYSMEEVLDMIKRAIPIP